MVFVLKNRSVTRRLAIDQAPLLSESRGSAPAVSSMALWGAVQNYPACPVASGFADAVNW